MANFFYNCLGYLPSPFLYGLVVQLTPTYNKAGENVSRWGMVVIMYVSIIGVISLAMGLILRKRSKKNSRNERKKMLAEEVKKMFPLKYTERQIEKIVEEDEDEETEED